MCRHHPNENCVKDVGFGKLGVIDEEEARRRLLCWENDHGDYATGKEHSARGVGGSSDCLLHCIVPLAQSGVICLF